MGAHDGLLEKWRLWFSNGYDRDVWDPARLNADSFCAYNVYLVDSMAGSCSYVLFMDSAADFLAFMRAAQLPFDLRSCYSREEPRGTGADDYLEFIADEEQRQLNSDCLQILDDILAQDTIGPTDVERAVSAYNKADLPTICSTIEAYGTITDVLGSLIEGQDLSEEEIDDLRADSEDQVPQAELDRLMFCGRFDPNIPEHLQIARDVLWSMLVIDALEPDWQPDWSRYGRKDQGNAGRRA